MTADPTVSVVIPVLDEAGTLDELTRAIFDVVERHRIDLVDIVFVDDGSTDGSWAVLTTLADRETRVKALRLRRNFGKAAALDLGIRSASGTVVVTMDADLQDDPEELPNFIEALGDDVDLVSGWKQHRQDPIGKTLPSRLFNWVTARISGVSLRDFNCGYKAYRREIFDNVSLYGELHRYVPVLANAAGFKVTEIPVRHRPRTYGRSKYGLSRMLKGLVDLLTVIMLTRFAQRPGHLFGGLGVGLGGLGFTILAYMSLLKFVTGATIGDRPLLLLGVMLSIIAVQVTLFGVLAELVVSRTRQPTSTTLVRERRG